MSRLRIPPQLILAIAIVLSAITFAYDLLEYYSSLNFQLWQYIHEALSLTTLLVYFFYLTSRPFFQETNVQKNLRSFIKIIAGFYILFLILKFSLNPTYLTTSFPAKAENFRSVIYSNLISLTGIGFLTPLLIIVKNLIKYKHRKRTKLYFIITVIAFLVSMVLTIVLRVPLSLNFSDTSLYNNVPYVIALLFGLVLASRNAWVTYLSRKEKYYYFIVASILVWLIYILFDLAFVEAVASHSLALSSYINFTWLFLVFYATITSLNLMRHLPTARVFDRKMKEVSSLHRLSRAISVEYDMSKLVQMVTDMSSEVIESSFTWLEIYDEEKHQLKIGASKNISDEHITQLNERQNPEGSMGILTTRETLVINDIQKSEFDHPITNIKRNVGSLVGVPMTSTKGKVFGILYAAKSESFGFDPDDVNMLEAYANQAAIALENAHLIRASLERERMEKELQIAREVQLRLLPQKTPELDSCQIDALTITAYEVGGDYYDFIYNGGSKLSLVIGDVSGKGTSAAFYMAETKGIIQSLAKIYDSPREILVNANSILYGSMEKKSFISLLAADFDFKSNIVKFARAGHCPVIHYNAQKDTTSILQPEGIAVGLDDGKVFDSALHEYKFEFAPEDILVFYTDGLSEARNEQNEEFGEDRLCFTLKQNKSLSVPDLKNKIIDEILQFLNGQSLHDDLTLILMKM